MRQEDKLKERAGNKLPYKVPEGYFKSFKENLIQNLPEYPAKPAEKRLTAWQRMRPYIYLAAMFAGIWCMMQIFHRVSNNETPQQDGYAAVTEAPYEPDAYDLYSDKSEGDDIELEDELLTLYPTMDEFKRDFYAQL